MSGMYAKQWRTFPICAIIWVSLICKVFRL